MSEINLEREIVEVVHQMTPEMQQEALAYLRKLARPKGISGKEFLELTRHIHIDPEDLRLMEEAIEEWCERIDDFPEVNFDE